MLHGEGDVLVIVSAASDMWWEHGGKVCSLDSMAVWGLQLEDLRSETGVNVQV